MWVELPFGRYSCNETSMHTHTHIIHTHKFLNIIHPKTFMSDMFGAGTDGPRYKQEVSSQSV